MATQEKTWNVANRMHSQKDSDNPEVNHIIAGADEIYDDTKGAKQSDINAQTETALADRYTKAETYSKQELNSLITTPDVSHVSVVATSGTTAVTDMLPAEGAADTIYRVGKWDGSQYDPTVYSLYAWNGTAYVCLTVRSFVGEVYDISANHPDGQGNPTPYADLTAALGTDGANIPADIRRGGMSIKFIQGTVQISDNKYVQFRYMGTSIATADFTNVANWQGVDDEPTAGSDNLVKSSGVIKVLNNLLKKQGVNIIRGKNIRDTGEFANSSTSGAQIVTCSVISGQMYAITGYTPAASDILSYAFYDSEDSFISGGRFNSGTNFEYANIEIPEGVSTIAVFGIAAKTYKAAAVYAFTTFADEVPTKGNINNVVSSDGIFKAILQKIDGKYAAAIFSNRKINLDGTLSSASLDQSYVAKYNILPNNQYMIHGVAPTSAEALFYAFYDSEDNFISGDNPNSGGSYLVYTDVILDTPSSAAYIMIFGRNVLGENYDGNTILYSIGCKPELQFTEELRKGSAAAIKSGALFNILAKEITPNEVLTKKTINSDGTLGSTSTTGSATKVYNNINKDSLLFISGHIPSSDASLLCAFYDIYDRFISGLSISSNISPTQIVEDVQIKAPNDTYTIRVFGIANNNYKEAALKVIGESATYHTDNITPYSEDLQKAISTDGTLIDASTSGAVVHKYVVDKTKRYRVCGFSPSNNLFIAFYDSEDNFVGAEHPANSTAVLEYPLRISEEVEYIRVFGNNTQLPVLKIDSNVPEDTLLTPMIFNPQIRRKSAGESIKVLCFGSSWFMDTWWYLNHILGEAWNNVEIHSYYLGSAEFDEWVGMYNNTFLPTESSRNARRCVSINNSDWVMNIKGSDDYTAQSFRDDFYNDLVSGDWDIIAFQQGARQAPLWVNWENYKELVSLIKRNCRFDTVIAFNQTWTPGVNSVDLSPDPKSVVGQKNWQIKNWYNTKKFMALSGIYNISPCGDTMWSMRRDETLNLSNDMAGDNLHPDNGLPIYGLAGTFYETFFAPMTGVPFDNIDWLPTTSTQKAVVSHSTWQSISTEQRERIRKIIKLSLSNRFGFNEFS